MGLLSGELTEQDLAFDETKLTDPKKYKRGALADTVLGALSGTAKGVTSVSNAASRFVEGDEVADRRMQQVNEATTPLNQGTAGHIASGITEVVSAGVVGAPLGPVGVATTVGLGTRATEHTKLTQQLGVDQDTADTASNLYGATNAALAFLPVSNVFKKSIVADYGALVVAPTIAGQGMMYVEGEYLEGKGYAKQGQQYKDMSTDPTAFLIGLGAGTTFFAAGRYMNAQGNENLSQAEVNKAEADFNATVEQAQTDADVSSLPNIAESADDLLQHQNNLNQAIDQVMKGEKVNISEATGGKLKTLDDVKKHIQENNKPKSQSLAEVTEQNKKVLWEKLNPGLIYPGSRTAQPTPKVSTFNIKAEVSKDQTVRVKDTYQAAQQAGFSPAQAKALTGELGRENDFNIETMFGFHTDAANHKRNGGIFSWQGDRATNLHNHMKAKGMLNTDGSFKRTNKSLKAQFEFLYKEVEATPKWKASFLDKKDITNEEARKALGGKGTIIGWARGQTKLSSGKAFDWQSHEARANKYSSMVDGEPVTSRVDNVTDSTLVTEAVPLRPESSYEGTVDRVDLDTLPQIDETFISTHDLQAFEARSKVITDPFDNGQGDQVNLLVDFELYKEGKIPEHLEAERIQFDKDMERILEAVRSETEQAAIPHTVKGVQVKDRVSDPAKEFKPDDSIAVDWKEKQRWENNKPHQELTRSYTDKQGNLVQELKYKDTYVSRSVDGTGKTNSIHVGRSDKSDFKDHKGNKELETALDRIFDEGRAFGYLSQIPKGQQTIDKLIANPDLVISSKKTGEDLTAAQWKDKLIREQDNIQMMAKAMSTLAKCAMKKAS